MSGHPVGRGPIPEPWIGYSIHVEPLTASVEVTLSRQQAEDLAIRESDGSTAANTKSMLVSATDLRIGRSEQTGHSISSSRTARCGAPTR